MDPHTHPHEPWVLAVDAVSACCALALAQGHWLRGTFYSHSPLTLSQRLLPALQTLLQNVECPLDRIRLVALNRGPGSFTALRMTLATLMALRVRVPFRVVPSDTLTLQVLRWAGQGEVWSLVPAGRTEFAIARFTKAGDRVIQETEVHYGPWSQVYPLLRGDDRPVLYPEPGVTPLAGSPRVVRVHERHRVEALLTLAQRSEALHEAIEIYDVQPYYLRPPTIRTVETLIPSGPGRPPGSVAG